MKKERLAAAKIKEEHDSLWGVVKLLLGLEKVSHGPTMVQGRDGGADCIKKQLAQHKLIRSPTPDTVVTEYVKLYNAMGKGKKKPSVTKPPEDKENQKPEEVKSGEAEKKPDPVDIVEEAVEKELITLDALRDPAAFQVH